MIRHFPLVAAVLAIAAPPVLAAGQTDPLASWNDGRAEAGDRRLCAKR